MDMNAWRIYPPWMIGTELSEVNHTGDRDARIAARPVASLRGHRTHWRARRQVGGHARDPRRVWQGRPAEADCPDSSLATPIASTVMSETITSVPTEVLTASQGRSSITQTSTGPSRVLS